MNTTNECNIDNETMRKAGLRISDPRNSTPFPQYLIPES